MAVSKETVNRILNFYPDTLVVEGQRIELGQVLGIENTHVVFGNYSCQARLVEPSTNEEPLLFKWETRPIVALERRDVTGKLLGVTKLAYATDIRALDGLAERVADHLTVVQSRLRGADLQVYV